MGKYLKYILLVPLMIQLIKGVFEFVEMVEKPGHGAEKKKAVMELLNQVYKIASKAAGGLPIAWATIEPVLSEIVDFVVDYLNRAGVFTHTETPTTG